MFLRPARHAAALARRDRLSSARVPVRCDECRLGKMLIDDDDERVERRYRERRGVHSPAGTRPITDGIRRTRQMLSRLRDRADLVIDTSSWNSVALNTALLGHFALALRDLRGFVTSSANCRRRPDKTACRADFVADTVQLVTARDEPSRKTHLKGAVGDRCPGHRLAGIAAQSGSKGCDAVSPSALAHRSFPPAMVGAARERDAPTTTALP